MCRGWILLLGLVPALCVGCLTGQTVCAPSWLEKLKPFQGTAARDVVVMDVALLERPLGDRYVNQDFWSHADEQVIAPEHKAVLEDNGFRIGQVGGITPAGLQALLTSERSCVNPRRIHLHADNPTLVTLGPALPLVAFHLREIDASRPVKLSQATCALQVLPSLTRDGRTRLRFTPQIQHGEAALLPQPAADRSGWEMKQQRPTDKFDFLSWDVVLASNEYVVIGARFDRPDTLGQQCFVRTDEASPVQRLLVIRTRRPSPDLTPSSPEQDDSFRRSPPLAYQAGCTTVRGQTP